MLLLLLLLLLFDEVGDDAGAIIGDIIDVNELLLPDKLLYPLEKIDLKLMIGDF